MLKVDLNILDICNFWQPLTVLYWCWLQRTTDDWRLTQYRTHEGWNFFLVIITILFLSEHSYLEPSLRKIAQFERSRSLTPKVGLAIIGPSPLPNNIQLCLLCFFNFSFIYTFSRCYWHDKIYKSDWSCTLFFRNTGKNSYNYYHAPWCL